MADTTRRDFLTTSAAVAAAAAAGRALGQASGAGGDTAGTFYERGDVRIRYLDTGGSGFPLLIIPGGGLNSTIQGLISSHPFNAIDEFKSEFRCVTCDLRTAYAGESTGPLESDRPWDAFTDDHVGIMDHLGIDKFMVLGLLHRRPVHLEPARARAQSRRRGRRGAAERLPARAARRSSTTTTR